MVSPASDAWCTALRDLRETLPERTVQNWLDPISPLDLDTDEGAPTLTLQVPTPFGVQYLRSRFQRSIRQAVTDAVGEPTDVTYQVAPESERPDEITASAESSSDEAEGANSSPSTDRSSATPSSDDDSALAVISSGRSDSGATW